MCTFKSYPSILVFEHVFSFYSDFFTYSVDTGEIKNILDKVENKQGREIESYVL